MKLEEDIHAKSAREVTTSHVIECRRRLCIKTPLRPAIAMGREERDKHVCPMTFELSCFFYLLIQVYLAHWKRRMHIDGTFARHAVSPLQNHLVHSGDGVHRCSQQI